MSESPQHRWYLRPVWMALAVLFVAIAIAATVGSYAWRRTAAIAWLAREGVFPVQELRPRWVPGFLARYYPEWALQVKEVHATQLQGNLDRLWFLNDTRTLDLAYSSADDAQIRGLRHFRRLNALSLDSTQITGTGLASLRGCRELKSLTLSETGVDDAGLAHLAGLPLTGLDLSKTKVTNAGMPALRSVATLRVLLLGETAVDGAGLAELRGLPLRKLHLSRTSVADRGFENLRGLSDLEELGLRHSSLCDEQLAVLADLPKLHALDLAHTPITGAGLASLSKLSLRILDLSHTRVTNEALASLKGHARLEYLELTGSLVDSETAKELADALKLSLFAQGDVLTLCDERHIVHGRPVPFFPADD